MERPGSSGPNVPASRAFQNGSDEFRAATSKRSPPRSPDKRRSV